jgi:hypothetical protein
LRKPRMTGLQVLKWLRANRPETQSILLGSGVEESEALALGITYLVKPFNLSAFISAVQSLLNRRAREAPRGNPTWLIECVAEGLLHLYDVDAPPVPVESMVQHPFNFFAELGQPIGHSEDEWNAYHQRAAWARAIYWRILNDKEFSGLAGAFRIRGERREADYFVRSLLMPARWMAGQEKSSVESLAHRFQVPPHIVEHRLQELRAAKPLLDWRINSSQR